MQRNIYAVIKALSIGLIGSAIAFELWNLTAAPDWTSFTPLSQRLIWLERLILAAHFLEAIVAAVMVRERPEFNSLRYGFYTFWVGTVGLQELKAGESDSLTHR